MCENSNLIISIGIVALNEESYLPDLLNDINNQNYEKKNIELKMMEEDLSLLRENTVDFNSFSYYYSLCTSAHPENEEGLIAFVPEKEVIDEFHPDSAPDFYLSDFTNVNVSLRKISTNQQHPLFIFPSVVIAIRNQFTCFDVVYVVPFFRPICNRDNY